jgi:short-subunit dehydrogenase
MDHRFALVTGATSGIGAAFARALPETTDLLLTGRDPDRLADMQEELGIDGRRVETMTADLTRPEHRQALIDRAEDLEIDLLINNAGMGKYGAVLDNDPGEEVATVELNCTAPVALTTALLPGMIERARLDGGRAGLINLSSTFAVQPVPYLATYTSSKAFIQAWTEALAEEVRRKPVDVLALAPGPTKSQFGERSGFAPGSFPFAADPNDIARDGLKQHRPRLRHGVAGRARPLLPAPSPGRHRPGRAARRGQQGNPAELIHAPQSVHGRLSNHGRACSHCRATCISRSSRPKGACSITPTGRPSAQDSGRLIAGSPVALAS